MEEVIDFQKMINEKQALVNETKNAMVVLETEYLFDNSANCDLTPLTPPDSGFADEELNSIFSPSFTLSPSVSVSPSPSSILPKKTFVCNICSTSVTRKSILIRHFKNSHGIAEELPKPASLLPFKCGRCNAKFKQISGILKHFLICSDPQLKCPKCHDGAKVHNKKLLAAHLVRHRERDKRSKFLPHRCERCERRFATDQLRCKHQTKHDDPTYRYQLCPICGETLSFNRLQHHVRVHYSDHICPDCHKRVWKIKDHMLQHDSNNFTTCERCGQKIRSVNYQRHAINCSGADFKCRHCGQIFTKEYRLRRHVRREHFGWRCNQCNISFPNHGHKKRHRFLLHNPNVLKDLKTKERRTPKCNCEFCLNDRSKFEALFNVHYQYPKIVSKFCNFYGTDHI